MPDENKDTQVGKVTDRLGKVTIPAAEVLAPLGHTKVKGTFVQRAGLWLAAGVGSIIGIITILLVVFLYLHYPELPHPAGPKGGPGAPAQYTIEEDKQLSEIAVKSTQELFQTVIAQVLIPVFTAILGYIFGRGGKEGEG